MHLSFLTSISYSLLPIFTLIGCALVSIKWQINSTRLSLFQHIAAGVVIASVTLELVPVLLKSGSLPGMIMGYIFGVLTMLLVEHYADQAGDQFAIAIDLFIDGFLLMIGFSTGEQGGLLLLFGLTLETSALGMVLGPSISANAKKLTTVLLTLMGLGLAILAGVGFGQLLPEKNGFWFAALLGFGVAALLYLVIEELITEAHATKDTPLTTALFFAGFLIPLVLVQLST